MTTPTPVEREARIVQFVDNWFAPWGAWKTAWWEGEVGDDAPMTQARALEHLHTLAAISPTVSAATGAPTPALSLSDIIDIVTTAVEDIKDGEEPALAIALAATKLSLRIQDPAPSAGFALEGWRPIASAPKDGTSALFYGVGKEGRPYMDVTAWPANWGGKWPIAYMAFADDNEPTHWMPLPPPPAADAGLEGK